MLSTRCTAHITKRFTSSMTNSYLVTLENIFSDENKKRVQSQLKEIEPSRSFLNAPKWAKGNAKKLKHAGVLVLMCTDKGQPSFVFTKRTKHLSNHKGEVSFPGGNRDKDDRDIIHTALRECEEEIGVLPKNVDVWGCLNPVSTHDYKKVITPVLAHCGEFHLSQTYHNEDEVEEVFTRSISSLVDPANTKFTRFRSGYTLPVYLGGNHRIWGLTAIVLHQTLTVMAPGLYTHKIEHLKAP